MKSLESSKFDFENNKLDVLSKIDNKLKNLEQEINGDPVKKARQIAVKQEEIEWKRRVKELEKENAETIKKMRENGEPEEAIKELERYKYFDPTFRERFISGPSMIYPKKNSSWITLIKNSNTINSAKLTAKNSTDEKPDVWNLLQTNKNIQKVANYLNKKFGKLKITDSLGIWFDEKEQKTIIYFERDGKTTAIPFSEI